MQLSVFLYLLGWFTSGFAAVLAIPASVALFTNSVDAYVFTGLATLYALGGISFVLGCKPNHMVFTSRDGILMTCVAWSWLSILGAIPLYFAAWAQGIQISGLHAVFEATSGLTTTGATVLSGLDSATPAFLLWRSLLQWLGGMGILVLAVAVLPFLGIGGLQLYKSELPGVQKDKLQPRLYQTARNLWYIYAGLTALCAFAYVWAGMTLFDAVNHAMTTVSTAGFSTKDFSFLSYQNIWIDWVAIIFMLLGAINFTLHFLALKQRSIRHYFGNTEVKLLLFLLSVVTFAITTQLWMAAHNLQGIALPDYAPTFHFALFNSVSIITSTGYSNADFAAWPPATLLLILVLMFVGGCSGSTTGGVKLMRVVLGFKHSIRELYRLLHPAAIKHIKLDGVTIPPHTLQAIWAFLGLYIGTFLLASILLAFFGMDLTSAFAAAAATLTNVGPGLGMVGPYVGYGALSDPILIILCFTMLLGRLELFTVLILFLPAFWRR